MEDFVYDHFLAIFGAKKMAEKYLHGFIVGVRALAEEEATRCTVFGAPPHVFTRSCSPMHQRLQPCAPEAAAPCTRGCNPVHQKLQPHAPEAATLCTRGCNPVHQKLQPHAPEAASLTPQARCSACWRVPLRWRRRRWRSAVHSTRRSSTQPSAAVHARQRALSRRTSPTPKPKPYPSRRTGPTLPSPKPSP
jgi:hypothetical protein